MRGCAATFSRRPCRGRVARRNTTTGRGAICRTGGVGYGRRGPHARARMTVVGERRLAMTLENETFELGMIAKAFQAISKEISYRGLAKALLQAALGYSGAVRGAVLRTEGDELLAKADGSFPRER